MGAVLKFPNPQTQIESKQSMFSDKFDSGYVMSSRLYRKEVMPFLSDAARNVYAELETRINGFQKETDFVSYSQLQGDVNLKGARILGRATVSNGLKELIKLDVISVVATGKQGTKSYKLNEVSLKDRFSNETSSNTKPVLLVNQTSSVTEPKLVQLMNSQYIDKENIKESAKNPENHVDEILNLWTPDLNSLNAWLQRSGEMPMTQELVNRLLLEINAHYEPRLKADRVTDSQMYSNFVKWIKRDTKKSYANAVEQVNQAPSHQATTEHHVFKGVAKTFKGMN